MLRCVAFGALAAFVATSSLAMAQAPSRVGVTSGASGDPLGKPPTVAERILRIGIDIQANELVTTQANDRAHLVFLDGSALTIGPNARLTIDKFVFDPNTAKGELAVNVSKGVLRVVGGRISKSTAIVVATPSATLGIRGGIAIATVGPDQTEASFLFGLSLAATSNGVTQTATRPGSQIVTRLGGVPQPPMVIPPNGLANALANLEGRTSTITGNPDEYAKSSGFADQNSGLGTNVGNGTKFLELYLRNGDVTNALSTADVVSRNNAFAAALGASVPSSGGPSNGPSLPPPVAPAVVAGPRPVVTPTPVVTPPVVTPQPVVIPTPVVLPPVVTPPVVTPPPAVTPTPVVLPPVVTPPLVTPPVVIPPVVTPPVVTPPVVTPPVVTPPPINFGQTVRDIPGVRPAIPPGQGGPTPPGRR